MEQRTVASPVEEIQKSVLGPVVHFFVLHPAQWMYEEMFPVLVKSEIPVFGLHQVDQLARLSQRYPGSVFCINVAHHNGAKHPDWPRFLGDISDTLNANNSTIIYMSRPGQTGDHKALRELNLKLAFLLTHHAPRTAIGQVHAVAKKFAAFSRRRSIRVSCPGNGMAVFNVHVFGHSTRGTIRDISSNGMAAIVMEAGMAEVPEGTELPGLQLKLRGSLILVDATVAAVRREGQASVWVVLFRWGIDIRSKTRIQDFICQRLQEELSAFLC